MNAEGDGQFDVGGAAGAGDKNKVVTFFGDVIHGFDLGFSWHDDILLSRNFQFA
jgi:hypothetical protein